MALTEIIYSDSVQSVNAISKVSGRRIPNG